MPAAQTTIEANGQKVTRIVQGLVSHAVSHVLETNRIVRIILVDGNHYHPLWELYSPPPSPGRSACRPPQSSSSSSLPSPPSAPALLNSKPRLDRLSSLFKEPDESSMHRKKRQKRQSGKKDK